MLAATPPPSDGPSVMQEVVPMEDLPFGNKPKIDFNVIRPALADDGSDDGDVIEASQGGEELGNTGDVQDGTYSVPGPPLTVSTTTTGTDDDGAQGSSFGIGPSFAVAIGGAIVIASAVFIGRKRRLANREGGAEDDGTATAMGADQAPAHPQDNDNV